MIHAQTTFVIVMQLGAISSGSESEASGKPRREANTSEHSEADTDSVVELFHPAVVDELSSIAIVRAKGFVCVQTWVDFLLDVRW